MMIVIVTMMMMITTIMIHVHTHTACPCALYEYLGVVLRENKRSNVLPHAGLHSTDEIHGTTQLHKWHAYWQNLPRNISTWSNEEVYDDHLQKMLFSKPIYALIGQEHDINIAGASYSRHPAAHDAMTTQGKYSYVVGDTAAKHPRNRLFTAAKTSPVGLLPPEICPRCARDGLWEVHGELPCRKVIYSAWRNASRPHTMSRILLRGEKSDSAYLCIIHWYI